MVTGQLRLKDSTGRLSNQLALDVVFSPTPPSSAPLPLMGGSTSSNSTWATYEAGIGKMEARRTFEGGGSALPTTFAASRSNPDIAAGRASYQTFKPNQDGGMATFATSTIQQNWWRNYLRSIPVGHRWTGGIWHEPEDDIAAGDFTLAQWKADNQRAGEIVHEVREEQGAESKIRHSVCFMSYWTLDEDGYGYMDWTFTAAQLAAIDVVCIDPYRYNPGDPSMEQMLTRNNSGSQTGTDRSVMTKLLGWGKPIVLAEWACTSTNVTDSDRAAWIRAAYAWFKSWNTAHPTVPIEAALWFHNNSFVPTVPKATWEVLGSGQTLSKQALIDITAEARNSR